MTAGGVVLALALPYAPAAAQVADAPVAAPPRVTEADIGRVLGDDRPVLDRFAVLAGFGFGIGASLITEYTDNAARIADDEPLPSRFRSRSDWRFRPSVNLQVSRPLGRQELFATMLVGRDFNARNTLLDQSRFGVNGGLRWQLGSRCAGELTAGFQTRQTQFDLFEEIVPSKQDRLSLGAGGNCRVGTRFSAGGAYSYTQTRNDNPERAFADVRGHAVTGNVGYLLGVRGQVGIQGNWGRSRYPNQILLNGDVNETEFSGVSIVGNYRIGTSLRANAAVGFNRVRRLDETSDAFSGTIWSLGLNYGGPRLGVALSAGRSVNGAAGGFANFQVAENYAASVNYRISERLSANAGVSRNRIRNEGISEIPGTERLNRYRTDRIGGGLDFAVNRLLSASFDLAHQRRASTPPTFDYNATTATLGLNVRL
jgi:hypothetical protein